MEANAILAFYQAVYGASEVYRKKNNDNTLYRLFLSQAPYNRSHTITDRTLHRKAI